MRLRVDFDIRRELLAGGVFRRWAVMLFGLLVGLTALDANLRSGLTLRAFVYLPNVIAAALILIL